ncbi:MAG: shikimate kinase [Clostridia bacterium]|nr:shikimate kinase [Clostridia bacterium]
MNTNENIVLTGMSGAGKSTLGVLLAKALGMDFIDTDILIQRQTGKKLQVIIDGEGIDAFLKIEEDVVSGLPAQNCVIATGGSVVYSEKAMSALRRSGRVVYLYISYDELKRRLTNITTRGIVMKAGKRLADVFAERLPLYERYSDITVDCTDRDPEACIVEIINALL